MLSHYREDRSPTTALLNVPDVQGTARRFGGIFYCQMLVMFDLKSIVCRMQYFTIFPSDSTHFHLTSKSSQLNYLKAHVLSTKCAVVPAEWDTGVVPIVLQFPSRYKNTM